jgi:hypothetical protein
VNTAKNALWMMAIYCIVLIAKCVTQNLRIDIAKNVEIVIMSK